MLARSTVPHFPRLAISLLLQQIYLGLYLQVYLLQLDGRAQEVT